MERTSARVGDAIREAIMEGLVAFVRTLALTLNEVGSH